MKTFQKIALLLALICTVVLLAACQQQVPPTNGSGNGDNNGSSNGNQAQTACANGHTPGEWVVDKPATEDEAGQRHRSCTVCGALESEQIAKLSPSKGLAYQVNGDNTTCTITGIGTCTDTALVIPQTIDGYTVTAIGVQALEKRPLVSVVIPDSVKNIGEAAFLLCSNLKSVEIGNGVESIGASAFTYCNSLTRVVIEDIAAWCSISFGDYTANPLRYANHLYLGENEITELVIPDGVTSIGNYAFFCCTGLTSVVIDDSVRIIGEGAFESCAELASVYYLGTSNGWISLSIGSSNSKLTSATRYYYSESAPTTAGKYWRYVNGVPTAW